MALSIGIVGLPNVGKSTLFNALLKKQQAYVANFPFATIEPNIGIVPVPDERLKKLSEVVKESEKLNSLPPEVPATVEFVDIAGLIAGAHKGEGLGNKFLSHIREVDAILHVVRNFRDENIIKEGAVDPQSDFEVIETELMMADLQTLEKQKEPNRVAAKKEELERWEGVEQFMSSIAEGKPVRKALDEKNYIIAKELGLLTAKPIMIVLNSDEEDLKDGSNLENEFAETIGVKEDQVIVVNAKLEEDLAGLSYEDQLSYLNELGVDNSGLEKIIKKAFSTLGLITFLTAGEKEVRAWTLRSGSTALRASSVIHTDFAKKFIKADVVCYMDFLELGGWKNSRDQGNVRSEGKDYIVKDGDVIEFKIGS
ncbi:redox-regulated ATPase YchF [Candidatus Woesebacteria bacterium]|nr:redox-regulated ATPase YchF [Candidatus Woesebacteria bacterium]